MKNSILFILLIILVGLTTLEFQKKFVKKPAAKQPSTAMQITAVPTPGPTRKETPVARTITGVYGCLYDNDRQSNSLSDTCILSLKLDDGSYVALKTGEYYDKQKLLTEGNRLQIKGKFVSKEQLNPEQWKRYNITGILRVSEITKK